MKQTQAKQLLSLVTIIAMLYLMPFASWANYNSARKMKVNECWPSEVGDDCGATGLNLTGAGQLITTSDTGIDTGNLETMHPDLKPNVIGVNVSYPNYAAEYDMYSHGTHTAGSMVGVGAMTDPEGYYRGIAYGAKLWAWMCGAKDGKGGSYIVEPINYAFRPPDYIESYSKSGMISHLYSASYGSDGPDYRGRYLATTKSIDDYCWNNPDFLPVWAAANSGEEGETTLAAQACAKNALVVGASDGDAVASFSSRGPTKDGRTKPDLCSPGKSVYSCNSTVGKYADYGYYVSLSGTSMATPLTAGTCALVREWLIRDRGFNETDKLPSSALIKAILMGGATKLRNVAKTAQGEGRINLRSSIAPDDGLKVYLKDRIPFAEGIQTVFTFTTTEANPLDAQLVWIDYPGSETDAQEESRLVNNLDLSLIKWDSEANKQDMNFNKCYGNGGEEADKINNAEAIHLSELPAGTYKVVVASENIPHNSTEGGAAALYLKGAFNENAVRTSDKLEDTHSVKIIVR